MTLTMTVDREGRFPEFVWEEAAAAWAKKCAPLAQGMLRARAPFRTGRFRESIDDRTEVSPGLAQVIFSSTIPYAGYITGGTRAHQISPRNAQALRWIGQGGMGVNFAKRVNHPGTRANDFAETAMTAIGPAVAAFFMDAVRESMDL